MAPLVGGSLVTVIMLRYLIWTGAAIARESKFATGTATQADYAA